MTSRDPVSLFGALVLALLCGNAYGRCAPSAAHQASFEILSCEDRYPNDRSKVIGFGAILEVNVLSRRVPERAEGYDWWPRSEPLPAKMKVFYDKPHVTCASVPPGVRRTGTLRYLCCDGAEPRCGFDTSIGLYDSR